jgi:hypothetical protein
VTTLNWGRHRVAKGRTLVSWRALIGKSCGQRHSTGTLRVQSVRRFLYKAGAAWQEVRATPLRYPRWTAANTSGDDEDIKGGFF